MYENRWHLCMTISFLMPVLSGRRRILSSSVPAMQAAAWRTSPPAAPLETKAASTPIVSAMTSLARLFSSWMWTGVLKALETVEITSGRALPPPYTLMGPAALTMGRTPIDLYSSEASLFNEFSSEEWMR